MFNNRDYRIPFKQWICWANGIHSTSTYAHGLYYLNDWEFKLGSKGEISFIVRGYAHDGACAVVAKHIIGNKDRNPLLVCRINRLNTLESYARFFFLVRHPLYFCFL